MAANDLYLEHAETIEAVLAQTRRAHRLTADAGDEFMSWARLRLIEHDCAILRKFQGRSSIRTFLITVVKRLFLDWRISEWGKWRPTADARRGGPVAVELERLIIRDGFDFEQAAESLVTHGVAASRDQCAREWARLPQRPGRRVTDEGQLANVPAPPALSADLVDAEEQRTRATLAGDALARALPQLPPGDQLIIRLRFHDGFTVARIAQLVGEEQRLLYRRIERMLRQLRAALEASGVSADDVLGLLGNPAVDIPAVFGGVVRHPEMGPSRTVSAGGEHE